MNWFPHEHVPEKIRDAVFVNVRPGAIGDGIGVQYARYKCTVPRCGVEWDDTEELPETARIAS